MILFGLEVYHNHITCAFCDLDCAIRRNKSGQIVSRKKEKMIEALSPLSLHPGAHRVDTIFVRQPFFFVKITFNRISCFGLVVSRTPDAQPGVFSDSINGIFNLY